VSARTSVLLVYGLVLANETVKGAFIPLAPIFGDELALSHSQVGVLLAAGSFSTLVLSIPIGFVVDRVGTRAVLVGATLVLLASTLAQGLAPDFWTLLLSRFAFGAASAAVWVGAATWLASVSSQAAGWWRLGGIVTIAGLGALAGPALAGVLADAGGVRLPFLCFAPPVALLVIGVARLGGVGAGEREAHGRFELRRALAERAIVAALLIQATSGIVEGSVNLLAPLELHDLGHSAGAIGAVFAIAAAAFCVTSAFAARRVSSLLALPAAGGVALLLAASILPFVVARSAAAIDVGVVLRAPFLATLSTIVFPLAGIGARRAGIAAGSTMALVNVSYGGAMVASPLAAGALAGHVGDRWIYGGLIVLCVAAAVRILSWRKAAVPAPGAQVADA
jgi:MFS family permease